MFEVILAASLAGSSDMLVPMFGDRATYSEPNTTAGSFYATPSDLPDTPGVLLRTNPVPHIFNLTGPHRPGHAYQILYTSTDANDQIVAVSGVVIEPRHDWEGEGPVPTVVVAPGTRGAADHCATSRGPNMLGQVHEGSFGLNYELPLYYALARRGVRVVVTDYIGLGTDGVHGYMNRVEQGHAVLDAARAVDKVELVAQFGSSTTDRPAGPGPVGLYGYSQGGTATAAAAELAATYAPELDIVGVYAGAPVADMTALMGLTSQPGSAAVVGYAIGGFADRYPEVADVLDRHVTNEGKKFFAELQETCVIDASNRYPGVVLDDYLVQYSTWPDLVAGEPALAQALDQQRLGQLSHDIPMMVVTSQADPLIPAWQVADWVDTLCATGTPVVYREETAGALSSLINPITGHFTPMIFNITASMDFLIDRFHCEQKGTGASSAATFSSGTRDAGDAGGI